MQNNYGLDSKVLDYLMQKRKPDMGTGALVGGIAQGASQLGTLGGRSADVSGFQKTMQAFDQAKARQQQQQDKNALLQAQIQDDEQKRSIDRKYKADMFAKELQGKKDLANLNKQNQLDIIAARNRANQSTVAQKPKTQNELYVPGVGIARTKDDAKKLKDAASQRDNLNNAIDEMIALRVKNQGGTINTQDRARGKQLSKKLLLTYKNLAKLGVLSKSDEDIINAIIPKDPLEFNMNPLTWAQGGDPILNNLVSLRDDVNKDYLSEVGMRVNQEPGNELQYESPGLQYYQNLADNLADRNILNIPSGQALAAPPNENKKPKKRFSWEVD